LAALRTVPAVDGRVDLQDDVAVLAGTPLHREAKLQDHRLTSQQRLEASNAMYGIWHYIVVHN
jgi:hypothetical protein